MCGILGYISFDDKAIDKAKFDKALQAIIYRGPNCQQSRFFDTDKLALGHVRLSIIDLTDSANQPMPVDQYYVVFNGEIYNYIELKEELSIKGYTFKTNSDTEVLVKAYDCWGESCVNRFNGMWGFAIYNTLDNTVFCSRDRFGIKPFCYYFDQNRLIFSSQVKPIITYDSSLRKPNYNSIALFCRESIGGENPETWFENINRLLPGHNLVVKNNHVSIYKYYNYTSKRQKITLAEAKNKFHELFIDSVKLRMRSDVPVGVTLSGGHDSTSVVAGVRQFNKEPLNTFTAHFPGFVNDEYSTAKKTNKHYDLDGNPVLVELEKDYIDGLSKIIYHLESGHASPAVFPLWKIYEIAKTKVTVVLEGQGADELLAGYIQAFGFSILCEKLLKFQFGLFVKHFRELARNYSVKTMLIMWLRLGLPEFVKKLVRRHLLKTESVLEGKLANCDHKYNPKCNSNSLLVRTLQYSHQTTLVNLLQYGDAISMAFSLESRLPFMDYRLVDFVMSLPEDFLINEGRGKYIQREALRHILPEYINVETKKLGFVTPIDDFFSANRPLLEKILLDKRTLARQLFNEKKLRQFINCEKPGLGHSNFLFRLLNVELWFRLFIDQQQ